MLQRITRTQESIMKLEEKSMKELLELHNKIADTPAGPKSFATKAKLLARIASIAEAKGINDGPPPDLADSEPQTDTDATARAAEATGAAQAQEKRGLGVGELARMLLMDPLGLPHAVIAGLVNAQIAGAAATDKSVRWYAAKMRKDGIEVPARAKHFPAFMDEKQSKDWLKTITVAKPASTDSGGVDLAQVING
jgi:hypothetical protein